MTPIRKQKGTQYKTLVKRTIVRALKAAFTERFEEAQFKNLRITPDFPMSKQDYPAIMIRYSGSSITNAGVGHEELFHDEANNLRVWYHRHFAGEIEFVCMAQSPLDRDVLVDAMTEILAFGWLDDIRSEFFDEIYGTVEDGSSFITMLNQLTLNTDVITPGGDSAGPAPWEPEDTLIYQDSLSVEASGGFYNGLPAAPDGWIGEIKLEVTVDESGADVGELP